MSVAPENPFVISEPSPPKKASFGAVKLAFLAIGTLFAICGGIGLSGLVYIGVVSPETSVYTASRVPQRFIDKARELGALDPGEKPKFFYSDGLLSIEEGFYLVTDSKVSIYVESGDSPLTVIPFSEIESAELLRDESAFIDSYIEIWTKGGEYHAFPVSSEFDRDELFFKEIEKNIQPSKSESPESVRET